jgi:hypothetical protein
MEHVNINVPDLQIFIQTARERNQCEGGGERTSFYAGGPATSMGMVATMSYATLPQIASHFG